MKDRQENVTALLTEAARNASRVAEQMPPPNTDALLRAAGEPQRSRKTAARREPHAWVPRIAAAAAVLAAAVGVLVLVQLRPVATSVSTGPVPDHLTALVDSLYDDGDYVVDQLAAALEPLTAPMNDSYMGDVWDTVASEVDAP
jgi:hypothetical protein